FSNRSLDLWGDPHGGGVPLAAVDNAMSHSLKVFKGVQSCRGASLQVIKDASDGIGVFFQLQLLADFLLARAAENEPRRFSCPIDVALGQQQFAFSLEETEFETTGACVTNQNFHTSLFSMAASYSSPSELALNTPSIVPQPDDWLRQVVFVTQRTHARGAQREVSTERDIKPEPTSGQYSQEMPARKKQHVTFDRAHALHH